MGYGCMWRVLLLTSEVSCGVGWLGRLEVWGSHVARNMGNSSYATLGMLDVNIFLLNFSLAFTNTFDGGAFCVGSD